MIKMEKDKRGVYFIRINDGKNTIAFVADEIEVDKDWTSYWSKIKLYTNKRTDRRRYLEGLLQVGNNILIVSKPHLECIKAICDEFEQFKKQIVFRFTIGSPNNDVLKFWEPGATNYEERKESLKYAFEKGFQTSVSCEPVLDEDIGLLVYDLLPFITDTIWIGKMNFIRPRVNTTNWKPEDWQYMNKVKVVIEDEFILDLYDEFKDNPKVKWKESIKKVLGLPEEECVG